MSVSYHTLSDLRVAHRAALDDLLTQVLAAMMSQGLVTLTRVAQDGTRMRARQERDDAHAEADRAALR